MKRIIAIILSLIVVVSLSSCMFIAKIAKSSVGKKAETVPFETEATPAGTETEDDEERYVYNGVSMILPEGFSVTTTMETTIAIYKDYPTHSDNITFVVTEGDGFRSFSKEALEKALSDGFGMELENYTYISSEEEDHNTVIAEFDVTYNGVPMHEKSCTFFFSGRSVAVTFVSVSGEFDDAFDQTFRSIRIEK